MPTARSHSLWLTVILCTLTSFAPATPPDTANASAQTETTTRPAKDAEAGAHRHVFNPAFEKRWGIWEAESRRLAPEDIIAMRRDYGLGIFFYRDATPDELREYKRLGMLNIAVAHALYTPWKDHAFLKDTDAVRRWVRRAVASDHVDGLAYDCESQIERRYALRVLQVMAEELKSANKLFIVCPHFAIGDPRFAIGPEDYNAYADIVLPWCYNRYGQPTYHEGIAALVRTWREVIPDRTVYPIIDCGKYRSPSEAAAVVPFIAGGAEKLAPVNGCTLFFPYASWSRIADDEHVQRFYRALRDHYGLVEKQP